MTVAHGLLGDIENMRMLNHFFAHIVITVFNHQFDIAVRMQPLADFFGNLHHFAFTRFKLLTVEIANDVVHFGPVNGAFHAGQMIKPFVTFSGFRRFIRRHFRVNPRRQRQRIDHHAFRRTRMHVIADDFDIHRGGIEVFKLQFSHAAAVDRIGPLRAKFLNIEVLRAFPYLFVRRKRHFNFAVGNRITFQHRQRGHDLRNTGFIVRAQQCLTIGSNQRLSQ
ncbi:Uncharacterised protein [Salmonella enterica subsp. enterica serovar Typhi]|nr:Uncharacterised protein [Salmonella enterica subsp. enterica serovar Typhi]